MLARTADPDPALAAFGVVEAMAWFVAAPVGQLQHAGIALVECSETHRRVRGWGAIVALSMTAVLLVLSLPAIREPVLHHVFALDAGLVALAGAALPIAAAYPLLYAIRQYYQGLFVRSGRTGVVGAGAVLRVAGLVAAALVVRTTDLGGAVPGVGLAVFGLAVEGAFLVLYSQREVMPELRASRAAAVESGGVRGGDVGGSWEVAGSAGTGFERVARLTLGRPRTKPDRHSSGDASVLDRFALRCSSGE